ncbi:hypothetical protein UFOVP74_17 [uncultured Caudovirales phage]|uniref:Uncharacterized protein n=1 Tax=uncultured Caudovirales phage TaxID=2100421 RepID=A0A6J5KZU3_9CAUD|nr:hypothetical protein UFOVP74_17 [uncultured Caudovirales phage]
MSYDILKADVLLIHDQKHAVIGQRGERIHLHWEHSDDKIASAYLTADAMVIEFLSSGVLVQGKILYNKVKTA